jgi:hypothetical protein
MTMSLDSLNKRLRPLRYKTGSSWNRVGRTGVSGREHAHAHERERTRTRTRRSVVTHSEGKV